MKRVEIGAKPTGPNSGLSPDAWVAERKAAEPTKRLTLDVPLTLHRRVKVGCARENVNMADVVRELLEQRFKEE